MDSAIPPEATAMLPKRRCEKGERAYCKGIREEEDRGRERWARVSATVLARRRASRGKSKVSISVGLDRNCDYWDEDENKISELRRRTNGKRVNRSVDTRCTVM